MKKYEMIPDSVFSNMFRLKALIDIPVSGVKKGDMGGWVGNENNLSDEGNCWVHEGAMAIEDSRVFDNAVISGNARIFGNAKVYNNAVVRGNVDVCGGASVYANAILDSVAKIDTDALFYSAT